MEDVLKRHPLPWQAETSEKPWLDALILDANGRTVLSHRSYALLTLIAATMNTSVVGEASGAG